jgi:hypothetical protein
MFVAATLPHFWSNVAAMLQISDMIVAASLHDMAATSQQRCEDIEICDCRIVLMIGSSY